MGFVRALAAVAVGAGLVLLVAAAPASGARIWYHDFEGQYGQISYRAYAGEANDVVITPLATVGGSVNGLLASDLGASRVDNSAILNCPLVSPAAILCTNLSPSQLLQPVLLGSVSLELLGGDDSVRVDERYASLRLTVVPGPGADTVQGGSSTDSFFLGLGDDDISGGGGHDHVSYDSAPGPVTVSLDDVANDGTDGAGDNIRSDVESLRGSRFPDVLIGSDGDDFIDAGFSESQDQEEGVIEGLAGDDQLDGGRGPVRIDGGPGDDVIDGGWGDDILIGGPGEDAITADVRASAGADRILVRDGERDVVTCGDGVDFVEADALDEIGADCEDVEIG